MGLQYRVDNWAKHKKAPDENSFKKFDPDTLNRTSYRPGRKPGKSSAWLLCIVYPLIAATPFCFAGDDVPKQKEAGKAIAQSNSPETQKSQEVTSPAIIIKADRQGHFRGLALINNVSMPFLIDTGATKTSIPYNMAVTANLDFGQSIQSRTAGGHIIDYQTRIRSLKIGNIEIKNLDANINQYLEEVLIGMNTLKYFHMLQTGNTLTLVANNNAFPAQDSQQSNKTNTQAGNKLIKKPFAMKKSVNCDDQKVCKTTYSDH